MAMRPKVGGRIVIKWLSVACLIGHVSWLHGNPPASGQRTIPIKAIESLQFSRHSSIIEMTIVARLQSPIPEVWVGRRLTGDAQFRTQIVRSPTENATKAWCELGKFQADLSANGSSMTLRIRAKTTQKVTALKFLSFATEVYAPYSGLQLLLDDVKTLPGRIDNYRGRGGGIAAQRQQAWRVAFTATPVKDSSLEMFKPPDIWELSQ